jgi:hypothetical protein
MDPSDDPSGQAVEAKPDDPPPEPSASPIINPIKADALRRLKALERRGKTVGTHLDELRALLTVLFQQLPD